MGYILVGYILVGYNILVGNIFTRFESYFVKILTHKNLMTMITTYKTSCPQRTLCMVSRCSELSIVPNRFNYVNYLCPNSDTDVCYISMVTTIYRFHCINRPPLYNSQLVVSQG